MKSILAPQVGDDYRLRIAKRVSAQTQVHAHGSPRRPDAPRDVTAQSGPGGALIKWLLPASNADNVTGWRIYKDTEDNIAIDLKDRGAREYFLPLTSGATPPITSVFLSTVNGFTESQKVQVKAQALADAASPGAVPIPPPGYSGGNDQAQRGRIARLLRGF